MLNALRRIVERSPRDVHPDEPSGPIDNVRSLANTSLGSGSFGRWIIDSDGLPAYLYELDQYADARAKYQNSLGIDRREHWFAFGNDRVTAIASNDGTIQFYIGDRGGTLLNRFDDGAGPDDWIDGVQWLPASIKTLIRRIFGGLRQRRIDQMLQKWRATHPEGTNKIALADEIRQELRSEVTQPATSAQNPVHNHYSGGYSYLDDGQQVWSTAYRFRPAGSDVRRVFGTGYFETECNYRRVRTIRRVFAPFGDDGVLISDSILRNTGDTPITVQHYEFWDINIHQLRANWFQFGLSAVAATDSRAAINANFVQSVDWDADAATLRARTRAIVDNAPGPDAPANVDWYPADIFLIDLDGSPEAVYTDKAFFLGEEPDPAKPFAVRMRQKSRLLSESSALGQPFCMVMRREVTLQPGEIRNLRYAYGMVAQDQPLDWVQKYRNAAFQVTAQAWKDRLAYFSTGSNPELSREMAWHAYALQVNSVYSAFYKTHLIAQGSAYLYLHGFDGAPRDQSLFALPLTYLRPELAKETLRMVMSLTKAETGGLTYAFSGHGILDSAAVHNKPSDLDLFLLLAVVEYLAATGDESFLSEHVPFYPAGALPAGVADDTVLDHVRNAFDHLLSAIGIGDNGLVKVGDGDWSDSIVIENAAQRLFLGVSFDLSLEHGESIPNTQMAIYILPLGASLLHKHDPEMAERMRTVALQLNAPLQAQWNGRWYTRAILRDAVNQQVPIGKYQINLEAQPWALISGHAQANGNDKPLVEAIQNLLDDNSPLGAPTLERSAQIAPAIAQLLTWAYSRVRPDLAWKSLLKQSYVTHAAYFPDIWFGIWSGPDSINPIDDPKYPGGTWASPVTPMTDFPALNSNPHAMSLLALIRLAGIEPLADGLRLAPRIPKEHYVLDLPLLKLEVERGRISVEYRAIVDGSRTFYVEVPEASLASTTVMIDGDTPHSPETFGGYVLVPLQFKPGQVITFSVAWKAVATEPVAVPVVEEIRL